MMTATFSNGEKVFFEHFEEHDDKVLFFRSPIGLVYSMNKKEILSITNDDGQNITFE